MDKENVIELTKKLYHLTLLFPKKEPLRYKIRELADDILANFLRVKNISNPTTKTAAKTEGGPLRLLEDLEVLDNFFEVALSQNWVSPFELLEVRKGYVKIKEEIEISGEIKEPEAVEAREMTAEEMTISAPQNSLFKERETEDTAHREAIPVEAVRTSNGVNDRQRRILEILKEKERVQVREIRGVFPQVTKRTLRRDFEQMFKKGLIERIGEKNDTYYQLKPLLSEDR